MLTPKYSTQLNPYYLCRMPRSKALKKSDGRQTCIVMALLMLFLFALGRVVERLPAPEATPAADVAGVWRPWTDGFTDTK